MTSSACSTFWRSPTSRILARIWPSTSANGTKIPFSSCYVRSRSETLPKRMGLVTHHPDGRNNTRLFQTDERLVTRRVFPSNLRKSVVLWDLWLNVAVERMCICAKYKLVPLPPLSIDKQALVRHHLHRNRFEIQGFPVHNKRPSVICSSCRFERKFFSSVTFDP